MKALIAGAAVAAMFATAALSDFYVIQEPTTKRCRIVEERPAPALGVIIGDRGFGVRVDAENHMRTVEVCRNATTGGGVTIEERERVRERYGVLAKLQRIACDVSIGGSAAASSISNQCRGMRKLSCDDPVS